MNKAKITVTYPGAYHHMPDGEPWPCLGGVTLRQAIKALRGVDWGNLGGMHLTGLSDGTDIAVELRSCGQSTYAMSSQRIVRYRYDRGDQIAVRVYKI